MKAWSWLWRIALLLALVANGIGIPMPAKAASSDSAVATHPCHHDAVDFPGAHHDHHDHAKSGIKCCGGPLCHCGCGLTPAIVVAIAIAPVHEHFPSAPVVYLGGKSLIDPRRPLRPPIA